MTLPVLRPGQTHEAVPKMKRALVPELQQLGYRPLAGLIRLDARTYGPRTVNGVKQFQRDKKLQPDGIVGEQTWRALGFQEPVVDERPPVLHGIPWEPGLMAIDSNWVDKPLGAEVIEQRRAGRWHGSVTSGYRPPWYQKRLFDAAVRKYGSVAAARKWVAPPGKSHHGMKGGQGAIDVTLGEELDRASTNLVRPMSWEAWHVQLAGTRELPETDDQETAVAEPSAQELEAEGVTMDDVDETIELLLDRLDVEGAHAEDGEYGADVYDPEEAGLVR